MFLKPVVSSSVTIRELFSLKQSPYLVPGLISLKIGLDGKGGESPRNDVGRPPKREGKPTKKNGP